MLSKLTAPKTLVLICWSLLPSIAIYFGMYVLKSAVWAYVLYHGIFLVPAVIIGRRLWQPTFKLPTARQFLLIIGAAIAFSLFAVTAYEAVGWLVLSDQTVDALLKQQQVTKENLLYFTVYATFVNSLIEELFWRGTLLNALDRLELPWKHFGIVWSSLTYAFLHYLIFRLVLYPFFAELGILMLAGFGATLAIIYRKTGSIITTALVHGLLADLACCVLIADSFRRYAG